MWEFEPLIARRLENCLACSGDELRPAALGETGNHRRVFVVRLCDRINSRSFTVDAAECLGRDAEDMAEIFLSFVEAFAIEDPKLSL